MRAQCDQGSEDRTAPCWHTRSSQELGQTPGRCDRHRSPPSRRMADVGGGSLMSSYRKFDPYKHMVLQTPAKAAKVAKEDTDSRAQAITLAGLAALAARSAEPANSSLRRIASFEHKTRNSDSRIDIPDDWAAGVRSIVGKPCPITIEPKRWLHLQKDANR